MSTITAIGLVSSLGIDAETSLAAARAGVTRCAPLRTIHPATTDFLQGAPVLGHAVPCGLTNGFVDVAKAVMLARIAIDDLLSRAQESLQAGRRIGCYVVLSDRFLRDLMAPKAPAVAADRPLPSETWRASTEQFCRGLRLEQRGHTISEERVYYGGHAGIVEAMLDAEQALEAGRLDKCIVGAVESCIEPQVLEAAAAAEVLKTAAVPTGFMPGEGAAFLLMERDVAANGDGGSGVRVLGYGLSRDDRHLRSELPPQGQGLAAAIDECLTHAQMPAGQNPGMLIVDLNGEERRALEWGYCQVRLRPRRDFTSAALFLPAASFGEAGCASGAFAVCSAVRGLQRGYADPRVLVSLSSEDGSKGALCLDY